MSEAGSDTAERILDAAQRLAQTRGFNAFSYKDVAAAVGIKHPSIHHHFATKAELGVAMVRRYRERFGAQLAAIRAGARGPREAIERYADLYRATIDTDERLCLCAMLSAEAGSLPEAIRAEVKGFFADNERWLADLLAEGRTAGAFAFTGDPREEARLFLAVLEGGMILVRGAAEPARLDAVARRFLARLAPVP